MITTYTNSKGEVMQITEMNSRHLQNAIKKIKSGSGKFEGTPMYQQQLLEALETEYKKRDDYVPDQLPAVTITPKPSDHVQPLDDSF